MPGVARRSQEIRDHIEIVAEQLIVVLLGETAETLLELDPLRSVASMVRP
jgi:hypothetical protein